MAPGCFPRASFDFYPFCGVQRSVQLCVRPASGLEGLKIATQLGRPRSSARILCVFRPALARTRIALYSAVLRGVRYSHPSYSRGALNTLHHTVFPPLMLAYPPRRLEGLTAGAASAASVLMRCRCGIAVSRVRASLWTQGNQLILTDYLVNCGIAVSLGTRRRRGGRGV